MLLIETIYNKLGLIVVSGEKGLKRKVLVPEAERPGLGLAGYVKGFADKRILVLGKVEIEYLKGLTSSVRVKRLKALVTSKTPGIIVARGLQSPEELKSLCQQENLPLFSTKMSTMLLLNKLNNLLLDEFAPKKSCHGCFVEVFGVGVLIQGESSVGKSEAALGLLERGHRLISDDLVKVKRKENYLEGSGYDLSRHHMEVRGIGIINVANIYGAVCVRENKSLDLVVKLETWNDAEFYDRVGLDEKMMQILGLKVPFHVLPVKPGRDVVLLLETIALNHRLKQMGHHSAKEFQSRLLKTIAEKHGKGRKKS